MAASLLSMSSWFIFNTMSSLRLRLECITELIPELIGTLMHMPTVKSSGVYPGSTPAMMVDQYIEVHSRITQFFVG
jgi:hypothetical protein